MHQHPKDASLSLLLATALIALGVSASTASGAPLSRPTEECTQLEKQRIVLGQRLAEINNKMNNEATGRGASRQPGIGPTYLALQKQRAKLEEENDSLDARWLQMCR